MWSIFNQYDILDLVSVNADVFVQWTLVFRRVCVPIWEKMLSIAARFSCVCNVCPALLFLLSMQLTLPFVIPCVWRYCLLLHYSSLISCSPTAQQMCRSVSIHLYHNSCTRNPIITIMGVLNLCDHTCNATCEFLITHHFITRPTWTKQNDDWGLSWSSSATSAFFQILLNFSVLNHPTIWQHITLLFLDIVGVFK